MRWANETQQEMFIKIEKQIEEGKKAEKLMIERNLTFQKMNQKQQLSLTAGLEAEVAKEFSKYDELLSVSNSVYNGKVIAGEFDGLPRSLRYTQTKSKRYRYPVRSDILKQNLSGIVSAELNSVPTTLRKTIKWSHLNTKF